jgi:hypothetical protein
VITAFRVEYAKTHARASRYVEEEELVLEEMRRTLRYLEWKASWWRAKVPCHDKRRIREGQAAYAAKQAAFLDELRLKFERLWRSLLVELKIDVDW